MKTTIEVEVPKDWLEFCRAADLFRTDHCGYWACGLEYDDELGWMVLEHRDDNLLPPNEELLVANKAWRAGTPLPPLYYRWGPAEWARAWAEGVKRHGERGFEGGGADQMDVAVQLALLGEVRYG